MCATTRLPHPRRTPPRRAPPHQDGLEYDDALRSAGLARCTGVDSGARNVDTILNGTLLPEIADSVLARMAEGGAIARIKVGATKAGKVYEHDAKITIGVNALYLPKVLKALRDQPKNNPLELEHSQTGLSTISTNGDDGCTWMRVVLAF